MFATTRSEVQMRVLKETAAVRKDGGYMSDILSSKDSRTASRIVELHHVAYRSYLSVSYFPCPTALYP